MHRLAQIMGHDSLDTTMIYVRGTRSDLPHTSATLMLASGEHPKIVQERLGHNDIGMTLNRYSHVTMQMQRSAADRLEDLIGGVS